MRRSAIILSSNSRFDPQFAFCLSTVKVTAVVCNHIISKIEKQHNNNTQLSQPQQNDPWSSVRKHICHISEIMEQISRQSRATLSLSPRLSYENVDHDYDNKLLIKYQNCSSFNNLIKFKKNDDNHLTDEKTNNKFKNIYNAKQISRFTLILTIFLFMIPITIISTATTSTTITSIPNSHQKHMRLFTSTGQQQRDLNQYKTVYACEGNKLELSCANEGKLIHLVRATYGRFSLSMCNEHGHSNFSVQCVQFRAFLIMQPM